MGVHADSLDPAVAAAGRELLARGVERPDVLGLLATGLGFLPERLGDTRTYPLSDVPGVVAPWIHGELVTARLGGLCLWLLDDLSAEAEGLHSAAPWVRGFPCWLAASLGARVLLSTSAGAALDPREHRGPELAAGTLALVQDHINFSGRTPLLGLGPSKYGPLFPDQTGLHDPGLRQGAARAARRLGLELPEVTVACTIGPSLDTPAERRFQARAGAHVAVQGIESVFIAGAHAGLLALGIVAITDSGEGRADLGRLIDRSEAAASALEDLLVALAPTLSEAVSAQEDPASP